VSGFNLGGDTNEAFEKTASQKIKRYLYHFANRGKKDTETPAKE